MRQRRQPAVARLGRHLLRNHRVSPALHLRHGHPEEFPRLPGPGDPQKGDKGHHIGPIGTLRVRIGAALHPGLKHLRQRAIKPLDALLDLRGCIAEEHGREFRRGGDGGQYSAHGGLRSHGALHRPRHTASTGGATARQTVMGSEVGPDDPCPTPFRPMSAVQPALAARGGIVQGSMTVLEWRLVSAMVERILRDGLGKYWRI